MNRPNFMTGIVYKILGIKETVNGVKRIEFVIVNTFKDKKGNFRRDYVKFQAYGKKNIEKIQKLTDQNYVEVFYITRGNRSQANPHAEEYFYVNLYVTNIIDMGRGKRLDIDKAIETDPDGNPNAPMNTPEQKALYEKEQREKEDKEIIADPIENYLEDPEEENDDLPF